MESAISEDITNPRFIPYIQLHEFEGLLFSDSEAFRILIGTDPSILLRIEKIVGEALNPELINDGQETAPSKRLQALFPGYKKVLHGASLAQIIGIRTIRDKCPRFNEWIEKLLTALH
jgi:hypothetical protein